MIVNPDTTFPVYRCNEKVMRYLVFEKKLPVLSIKGKTYSFAYTDELRDAVKEMPLRLKFWSAICRKGG